MRLNLLFRSNEPNNSKRHKLHALRKDGGHGFVFADETESEPRPTDNYHPAGRHGPRPIGSEVFQGFVIRLTRAD